MRWLADHRMAALGFVVAIAYWPGMLMPAFTPRWAAIAVGIPLLARIDPFAVPSHIRWVLAFVLAAAAMSTAWASPDPMGGWLEMMQIAILCMAFVAGANLDSIDDVMGGLAAGLAVTSFLILWQLSADDGRNPYAADPVGLFYNTEVCAEFAALIFVWGAARLDPWVAIPAVVPVLLCGSRVAAAAAAAGLLAAFHPRSKALTAAIAVLIVAGLVALLTVSNSGKVYSADIRLTVWLATIFSWTQYGHGLGWFQAAHPGEEFAHSDALQIIAEVGIVGFALLAIPFTAFRHSRDFDAERALFIAVCVEMAISFPLHMPATGFVAALVAGFLVGRGDLVRVGQRHVGPDDGDDILRREAAGGGNVRLGGRFGGAIPVRSSAALEAPLRASPAWGGRAAVAGA